MVGQTVDRYTLVEKLGSGGMGDVFKGHHTSLNHYRAIKILPGHLSRNPELVERFLREARRCASLSHPNIIRLEHVGEQDGLYFMVMDYVAGPSLRQVIDQEGPLPIDRALRIIGQVCEALSHAHAHGVVHRDVKPSNILIGESDYVVLTDFGIARGMEADEPGLTSVGVALGTPEYMSPEQIRGLPLDGRTDLYSLGVVLYEALTGELPFSARSKETVKRLHLEKAPDAPRLHNPEISPAIEGVILKALAKDAPDRFRSAGEMAGALEDASSGLPQDQPHSRPLDTNGITGTHVFGWVSAEPAGSATGPGSRGPTVPAAVPMGRRPASVEATTVLSQAPPRGERRPDGDERGPFPLLRGRMPAGRLLAAGAAAILVFGWAVGALQALGNAGRGVRFTAEKSVDPRTGKEYGMVMAHGAPVFAITQPLGDLSPAQRAEKAAERLQNLMVSKDGKPMEPDRLASVVNGRGEVVIAHRPKGASVRDLDPEDVIVTVDRATATTYGRSDRSALAAWWRDVLRDHVRLARGRPPVSTYETRYGRILDRVHQAVEAERQDGWVPAAELKEAFEDLSESHRSVVDTAWRSVPAGGKTVASDVELSKDGQAVVQPKRAAASDGLPGYSAARAVDGDSATAWQSHHGELHHGQGHWLKLDLPAGTSVGGIEIREGTRSYRPEYQFRIKTARVTFSDGTSRQIRRNGADDPLEAAFAPRATRWVKIEPQQFFDNRDPSESHVYISEVKLWGP